MLSRENLSPSHEEGTSIKKSILFTVIALTALVFTIQAFGQDSIRELKERIIDKLNNTYAVHAYGFEVIP